MKTFAKGIGVLVLALGVQASAGTAVQAAPQSPIAVTIDGKALTLEQAPIIKNDRTLVPMRAIFETLGAQVKWDAKTRTVTGKKGPTQVTLTIGSKKAIVNQKSVTLDAEAQIMKDRTMVPVRFVSESLGANVMWDAKARTVLITMPTALQPPAQPETPETPPTDVKSRVVGTWKTNYSGFSIDVDFKEDNTAVLLGGLYKGTYTIDKDQMTLNVPDMNRTTKGKIEFVSDKEFTVTSSSGNVATFTHQ